MLVSFEHHRPETIFGHLIAWWTHSPFSHTAISIEGFRYEALMSKGFTRTLSVHRDGVVETVIDVPETTGKKMIEWLEAHVGTKYPKPWYLALQYVFPFLTDIARKLYCSLAIRDCCESVGLYVEHDKVTNVRCPPGAFYFIAQTLAARPDLRKLGQ